MQNSLDHEQWKTMSKPRLVFQESCFSFTQVDFNFTSELLSRGQSFDILKHEGTLLPAMTFSVHEFHIKFLKHQSKGPVLTSKIKLSLSYITAEIFQKP